MRELLATLSADLRLCDQLESVSRPRSSTPPPADAPEPAACTEMDTTQARLYQLFGLDAYAPRR